MSLLGPEGGGPPPGGEGWGLGVMSGFGWCYIMRKVVITQIRNLVTPKCRWFRFHLTNRDVASHLYLTTASLSRLHTYVTCKHVL